MTLDWLLIFGAIAGLAAGSVLAVQITIDNSTDLPDRPDVRLVDAEIAAATVASEATEIVRDNPGNYQNYMDHQNLGFQTRCQGVAIEYSDVVKPWVPANWEPPTTTTPDLVPELDKAAICRLIRR